MKAKKAAKKKVAKVSPLRGTSAEALIAKIKGPQREIAEGIRDLVAKVAPKATLSVKWSRPVWDHNGPFAFMKDSSKHVTFGFWRGAELDDPCELLEGTGDRMRHLKLRSVDDLKNPEIRKLVKQALALNDAKGDPTKRS